MGKKGIFQDKDWYVPFCNDLIFMAEKKRQTENEKIQHCVPETKSKAKTKISKQKRSHVKKIKENGQKHAQVIGQKYH